MCGALSWFVQVTAVPVFTVMVEGSKAKFLIVIAFPPGVEDCWTAGVVVAGVW